jgi:copper chaperone
MTTKTSSAPDIHCGGCAKSTESAQVNFPGIDSVRVKLDDHTVEVSSEQATVQVDSIVEAIEDQGYVVAG